MVSRSGASSRVTPLNNYPAASRDVQLHLAGRTGTPGAPTAHLHKKATGQEAKLCYLEHVLMENRHGLVVDARVTHATGTVEREAALEMAEATPG